MSDDARKLRNCGDCGVKPGQLHKRGCDVERCPDCGTQRFSCECPRRTAHPRLPWAGEWPGDAECREFGWYVMPGDQRSVIGHLVPPGTPGAREAQNHLALLARWDASLGRYVRDPAKEAKHSEIFAAIGGPAP